MKIFKGRTNQILCGLCHTWVSLQALRRIRKVPPRQSFTDGRPAAEFSRIYECPRCGGPIMRSLKVGQR